MGVPNGYPFFGNQYTNGGYIPGSFTYEVPKIVGFIPEPALNPYSKLVTGNYPKKAIKIAKQYKTKELMRKVSNIEGAGKVILIVVSIGLAAGGGYLTYRYAIKKVKEIKGTKQPMEFCYTGICSHCGASLIGSIYVPENEADNQTAYIICKECGEKNFAFYPDENNPANRGYKIMVDNF